MADKEAPKVEEPQLTTYFLPEYGVSVEASSIEDAIAKVKKGKK